MSNLPVRILMVEDHKLMRVGVISCDTVRHDSRNKILIFIGE